MRRFVHQDVAKVQKGQAHLQPERRPFFKRLGTYTLMGLTAVSLSPFLPFHFGKVKAQGTEQGTTQKTMVVQGRTLTLVQLDKPLATLEQETGRAHEVLGYSAYTNFIKMPSAEFGVTFDSADHKHPYYLTVAFSESKEKDPTVKPPGLRGTDLGEFADLVKGCGKPLERVKLIAETGTFNNNGIETPYINVYIIPVNAAGKAITCLGDGKYLIYNVSYYDDVVGGGTMVLVEPTSQYSIQIASR
jgi:hypothetical protein